MEFLFEQIERELTGQELANLLAVAQAALDNPSTREVVLARLGLTNDAGLALLHNVTEVLGGSDGE
jgi:ABC-type transporter Mla MlaB component